MPILERPLPLRCGLTLPNRIVLAPMTNRQSNTDGTLAEPELEWLRARAMGGFGLVMTCAAFVNEEGKAWQGQLGAASDTHLPGLRRVAAALREAGAAPFVQLHHGGKMASFAPGLKLSTADGEGTRGATPQDLRRVVRDFVQAAQRAEAAGFAGVEIHGANGYLFTQFLAPADNPRTDSYGGDLAGRARLLRETVRAVRAATSAGFAVGVRISPVDVWAERGLRLDDGVQLARWLADDGVDFVHLSLASACASPPLEPDRPPVVQAIRASLPAEVPLIAVGGIWTRAQAQAALDLGASAIALGRAAIVHADWPRASSDPAFEPQLPPWSPGQLRSQAVGEAMIDYLRGFRGPLIHPGG